MPNYGEARDELGRLRTVVEDLVVQADTINLDTTDLEASLTNLISKVDQLEGYTDGLEALIGVTNTALATIGTYLDGVEPLLSPSLNATTDALAASKVVKAAAGTLYGVSGFNSGPTQYIQIHDAAALPANGAVPILPIEVPAGKPFAIDFGAKGRAFATGIVVCNSTTLATKTLGAADSWFDAQYS